jgi:hypothetical protein
MTDQHTPGPWRWVPEPDYPWQYQDLMSASGEVVLSGEEAPDPSGIELSHADARLIAAAPDLLEACQTLATLLDTDDWIATGRLAVKQAQAAIAKVRGTQ